LNDLQGTAILKLIVAFIIARRSTYLQTSGCMLEKLVPGLSPLLHTINYSSRSPIWPMGINLTD